MPHLIIKNVPKASQPKLEELMNHYGEVERIYYGKATEYPYMFVVFRKETNMLKAYVAINENFKLYEVSLKSNK